MKRKQTSRFISLLLGIVLIFSMVPTVFAADYNDLEDNKWYRTAIDYVTRVQSTLMFMRFMENIAEEPASTTAPAQPEEDEMIPLNITVGNTAFNAKMYDNETTQAWIAQMPLMVNMSELDGKEKFYHFPSKLPGGSTEMPATIHAGEIMLWSSNSLVLFYNTFSNSYGGYVKLGYIENISGLTSALGRGGVQVTFSIGD